MNIKKSCNCRSEKVTSSTWDDFLFFIIQQANKNNKARAVVSYGGAITDLQLEVANELGLKQYALVNAGLTSINQVIVYERPF